MRIGTFVQDKNGVYQGRIYGLGIGVTSVMLEPQTSKDGNPYFRLIADPAKQGYEIGYAFPKLKDGRPYHSVSIDSPALAGPVNAALFPDKNIENAFNLVWNRSDSHGPKAESSAQASGKSRNRAAQPAL